MDKFDRYYKRKNLYIREHLINTYAKYNDKTLLISNGYSVVYTKTIPNNFKENTAYSDGIKRYYDDFKAMKYVKTLELDDIKNNLDKDKICVISDDFGKYAIDYMLLKKIIDIIGCERIDVVTHDKDIFVFKIVGKENQVGYLLPCRVY